MKALKILQSAINTDYDFINKFETDEELEEYTLLAIKELEDLIQENEVLRATLEGTRKHLDISIDMVNKMLEELDE